MQDISVYDFFDILALLEPDTPLCNELDIWGSPYNHQKAHCLAWFGDQPETGTGAYSRTVSNTSTKKAYNRLLNPGMLIWMAESLGANEEDIRQATTAAVKAEKENYRKRCTAFRGIIPFEYIFALLEKPDRWIYDKQIERYLSTDKQGYRHVKPGKQRKVESILIKEIT